jgi:hypothetical protein
MFKEIRNHKFITDARCVFGPALMYDSERKVLRSQDKKRAGTSQTRLMRSMLGVAQKAKMRSEDVKESTVVELDGIKETGSCL